MRLSASRIRSINRRLARAQGFTWRVHNTNHSASLSQRLASDATNPRQTVRVVAVPRSTAA